MMISAARSVLLSAVFSAGLPMAPAQAQSEPTPVPDTLVEAVVYTTLRPTNWDIYLFEPPGGVLRRLTDDPALDYNAVFSPDGRWVVFTSERAGGADLYALDLEAIAAPVRLTYHPAMDDAATFSPDGEKLAFVSTRDGYADIFVMPFSPSDTGAEARAVNLTRRPGGDFNPAFSPDGRSIAFSRQEHLWETADSEFANFDVQLYVMDADGSNARQLSEPEAGRLHPARHVSAGSPAWSRNGEAIYYYRTVEDGFEIRRMRRDGSGDVRLVRDGLSPAIGPGGRIAFVRPTQTDFFSRTGDVVSVAEDGSASRSESAPLDSCFAPDFDGDSERMVCHGPGPADGLVLLDDGGSFAPPGAIRQVDLPDRTLMVRGIRGAFPALTPAGEVISTLGGISARASRSGLIEPLHISAVDGSGMRELFTPPSGVAWGAAVAGNRGSVVAAVGPAFAAADTRVDIWKLRLDGSDPVNLTPDSPANDALPHIAADGQRIVFRSSRDGNMAVYVMDGDGQNPRRLSDSSARETMPALSPDGDWVVFPTDWADSWKGSFAHKLWLQRVDGSAGRLLEPERADIPDISMHPRFSPDGKWVVFTSNRGGFNDEWPLSLAPQPYGDLWAVPVAGGPAVRLTHDKWEDGPNDWGYVRLAPRH